MLESMPIHCNVMVSSRKKVVENQSNFHTDASWIKPKILKPSSAGSVKNHFHQLYPNTTKVHHV